jgi:hypothetical protein
MKEGNKTARKEGRRRGLINFKVKIMLPFRKACREDLFSLSSI